MLNKLWAILSQRTESRKKFVNTFFVLALPDCIECAIILNVEITVDQWCNFQLFSAVRCIPWVKIQIEEGMEKARRDLEETIHQYDRRKVMIMPVEGACWQPLGMSQMSFTDQAFLRFFLMLIFQILKRTALKRKCFNS